MMKQLIQNIFRRSGFGARAGATTRKSKTPPGAHHRREFRGRTVFASGVILATLIPILVGCDSFLPLLPSASITEISPSRVLPGGTFEVHARVIPDVTSCVLTAFGARTTCATVATGCHCTSIAPDTVIAAFGVVEVAAVTSTGIATAKGRLVVDGAPPAIDTSRVEIIRRPVGENDGVIGEVGSVVDRPIADPSNARVIAFATADVDAAVPLAEVEVNADGSFGPIDFDGTSERAPGRVFLVVIDALGSESSPVELTRGRDTLAPQVEEDAFAIVRREIGAFDSVTIDDNALVEERELACAFDAFAVSTADGEVLSSTTVAPAELEVGEIDRSAPVYSVVATDKCGNATAPIAIAIGADIDLPTIDLRIVDAKRTGGVVHVVAQAQAFFDRTSAVRAVEVFVDDVMRVSVVPAADGSFVVDIPDPDGTGRGDFSVIVEDKVGHRTVRVGLVAFAETIGPTNGLVIVDASSSFSVETRDPLVSTFFGVGLNDNDLSLASSIDDQALSVAANGPTGGPGWLEAPVEPGPVARAFAGGAVERSRGALVVMGGANGSFSTLADSWRLVDGEWQAIWGDPAQSPNPFEGEISSPSPRSRPQVAFDGVRNQVMLFGGEGEGDAIIFYDDTWVLEGDSWTVLTTPVAPPPRAGGALVEDLGQGLTLLIGGDCYGGPCDDVWAWDGFAWELHPSCDLGNGRPAARYGAQVAYDPSGARVVVFGGIGVSGRLDDTWVLDIDGWRRLLSPSSPSPRAGGSLVFDPSTNFLVLFGGDGSDDAFGIAWALLNDQWVQVPLGTAAPSPRAWAVNGTLGEPTVAFGVPLGQALGGATDEVWRGHLSGDGAAYSTVLISTEPATGPDSTGAGAPNGVRLQATIGGHSAAGDGVVVWSHDAEAGEWTEIANNAAPPNASVAAQTIDVVVPNAIDGANLAVTTIGPSTENDGSEISIDAVEIDLVWTD